MTTHHRYPSAVWPAVALVAQIACLVAFVRLPWASGQGDLRGRDFSGPELARLARNLDIVLGGAGGGPASVLLPLALYAVRVAAITAALLTPGACWTHDPRRTLRIGAAIGLVPAVLALLVLATLAAGPAAGEQLARAPATGPLMVLIVATTGSLTALSPSTMGGRHRP